MSTFDSSFARPDPQSCEVVGDLRASSSRYRLYRVRRIRSDIVHEDLNEAMVARASSRPKPYGIHHGEVLNEALPEIRQVVDDHDVGALERGLHRLQGTTTLIQASTTREIMGVTGVVAANPETSG